MTSLSRSNQLQLLQVCDTINRTVARTDAVLNCIDLAITNRVETPSPSTLSAALDAVSALQLPLQESVLALEALLQAPTERGRTAGATVTAIDQQALIDEVSVPPV